MVRAEIPSSPYDSLSLSKKIEVCRSRLQGVPAKKIVIDGPAAVGKGTLSGLLVRDFDLASLSTGDLYRVLTWYLLQYGYDEATLAATPSEEVAHFLQNCRIDWSRRAVGW